MFTQIQEARKRRAEALGPEVSSSPPQQEQNDNSVALANIEHSLQHANGRSKVDAGGVFEVRDKGYEHAEVVFHGWSPNARRNSTRVIPVEQGPAPDIETAIVNKIIGVIREEKTGDFLWDSHRLGRTITLSARVQDTAELRRILMQEFFPEYLPAVPSR